LKRFPGRTALKQGDCAPTFFFINGIARIRVKLQLRDSQGILQNPKRFMPGIGNVGLSQGIHRSTI